jgi:hypothetical protein
MPLVLAPVVRVAYSTAVTLGRTLPASLLDAARLNPSLLLRHQLSLVMAVLTGLLAREMFLVIRQLGGTATGAFMWALLFAMTPPALSHAFLFFTEIPSALITVFVFRRLVLQQVTTVRTGTILGLLTGFLLLVHARNVGNVAGLTLVALLAAVRDRLTPRMLATIAGGIALGVLGRTLATFVLWGSFVTTPHAALGTASAGGDIAREVFARGTGLLFDREYGLLAYGPIYLLAAPGLLLLAQSHRPLLRDLLIVVACYLAPVLLPLTNVHGWTGGWSPAARFLMPIAPLLWIGVYSYASGATRRGLPLVAGLVLFQLGIDAFVWQFPKTLWNEGDGLSALGWARWLPSWTDPAATLPFAIALAGACAIAYGCWRYTVRTEFSAPHSAAASLPRA